MTLILHRPYGGSNQEYRFVCDEVHCGVELETGEDDFYAAVQLAKREGWYFTKIGDDWEHRCLECGKARWLEHKREEEARQLQNRVTEAKKTGKLFGHLKS